MSNEYKDWVRDQLVDLLLEQKEQLINIIIRQRDILEEVDETFQQYAFEHPSLSCSIKNALKEIETNKEFLNK
jgi:hypothetical protein